MVIAVHVNKEPLSLSSKSDFDLGKRMEEARQNGLFTDVTLVADGKEFKVVLASQSQFFKTLMFASRWSGSAGDKVEMALRYFSTNYGGNPVLHVHWNSHRHRQDCI